MTVPIMSQAVFDAMDKNKDGLVSKGELHLAQRGISMKELADILQELDNDGDGKLTFDEIKSVIRSGYGGLDLMVLFLTIPRTYTMFAS